MDIRHELQQLPDPSPEALNRVWKKFSHTRQQQRRRRISPWLLPIGAAALVAAAVLLVPRSEVARTQIVGSVEATDGSLAWSEVVELDYQGTGEIKGLAKNAEIHWKSGTITAHVTPHTDTHLAIVTDEARIEVVGTVFSVTRDRLGVTTTVERGRVKVNCTDGWSGEIGPSDGAHTCLPNRPGQLLGRADALIDADAPPTSILQTLEIGISRAERDSAIAGELLVRRMHIREQLGDLPGVFHDADAYLAGPGTRRAEVQRFAGWTALNTPEGCTKALPYLSALELTGTVEDRVLLAECLLESQPARAQGLLEDALPQLPSDWAQRAKTSLHTLKAR